MVEINELNDHEQSERPPLPTAAGGCGTGGAAGSKAREIVAGVFDRQRSHPERWYRKFDDAVSGPAVSNTDDTGVRASPGDDPDRQGDKLEDRPPDLAPAGANTNPTAPLASGIQSTDTDNDEAKAGGRLPPSRSHAELDELRGPVGVREALGEYGVPEKSAMTAASTVLTKEALDGPVLAGAVMNVTVDGGLRKRVLLQGESAEKPQDGWRVWISIHCVEDRTHRLVFSTSKSQQMIGFDLGGVLATQAVDLAIRSLSKGEEAEFFMRKELSYGGLGGCFKAFPKDRHLRMLIKLLDWDEMINVPGQGCPERAVTKHVLCRASKDELEKVDAGATVALAYECCLAAAEDSGKHPRRELPHAQSPILDRSPDGSESLDGKTVWDRRAEFVFTLGEDQVPEVLEQCVLSMKRFEESDFWLSADVVNARTWPMDRISWGQHAMPPDPMEAGAEDDSEETVIAVGLIASQVTGVAQRATAPSLKAMIAAANRLGANIPDTIVDVYAKRRADRAAAENADYFERRPHAVSQCEGSASLRVPPAGRALRIRIKLLGLKNVRDQFHMFDHEKIIGCYRFKDAGRRLFLAGDYDRALLRYQRAYEYVCLPGNIEDKRFRPIAVALYGQVLSNMAFCCLKRGHDDDWAMARRYCDKSLSADPDNVKTLYRLAKAHGKMNNMQEAVDALNKAASLDPQNRAVRVLRQQFRTELKAQSKKQLRM